MSSRNIMLAAGGGNVSDPYFKYTTLLLSADNVTNGAQNNTIIDSSTNNFTVTAYNGATLSAVNPFGNSWATFFVGNTAAALYTTYDPITTGPFTIEFWMLPRATVGSRTLIPFWNGGWNAANNRGFYIYLSTAKKVVLGASAGSSSMPDVIQSTSDIAANIWTHVAITRDNSNVIRLFINGVLESSVTYSASLDLVYGSPGNLYTILGTQYADGAFQTSSMFTGYISNFRIVKGNALYTSDFAPSIVPLTAVSGTSLLTCQSNRPLDNSSNNYTMSVNEPLNLRHIRRDPFNRTSPYSSSVDGGSAWFDAVDDYIETPSSSAFALTGEFTLECWYNQFQVGTYPTVFELGQYTNGILFRPANTGNGTLWINNSQVYGALSTPYNAWTHVAISRDSNNLLSFYINGQRLYSATISGTINSGGEPLRLGSSRHASGQYHLGWISGVRLVNGSKVYDPSLTSFTVPTSPPTAVPNTVLLCTFSNPGIYDATTNISFQTAGDVQVSTSVKKYGTGSIKFDGSGDYLRGYTSGGYILTGETGDFTLEFWVYPAVTQTSIIYDIRDSGSSPTDRYCVYLNNNVITYYAGADRIVGSALSNSTWYHVAVSRTSSVTRMFVDGTQVGSEYIDSTLFGVGLGRPIIGASGYNLGGDPFNGYLDDIRFTKGFARYTANFTPSDWGSDTALLTDQYYKYVSLMLRGNGTNGAQNNTFIDSSNNNLTITRGGNTTQGSFSPFSLEESKWSNYFDGSGDYLSIPSNAAFAVGTGDFTIETWIKLDQPQSTGSMHVTDSTVTNGLFLKINTTNICIGRSNVAEDSVFTYSLTQGVWYHVLFSRSGSTVYGFVNGTLIGSNTNTNNYVQGGLYIGCAGGAGQFYKGYVSSLRMIKGTALYTSNFTVPTSPLTAVSGTSLLTCQSNYFKDNSSNNLAITAVGDTKVLPSSPFAPSESYQSSINSGSGYFDGSDYLSTTTTGTVFGTGDFTIEFWVYPLAAPTTSWNPFLSIGASGGGKEIRISQNINGTGYGYLIPNNTSTADVYVGFGTLPLYQWHHIALVRNGSTVTFYRNGQVIGTTSSVSFNFTNAGSIDIGYGKYASDGYTNGYISNVRVVKGTALYTSNFTPEYGPLSAVPNTSLLYNFNNAGIVDTSKNNISETIGNSQVSTSVVKYGTGAMYFDGSGDYLTMRLGEPFNFGTGNFTIEMWIYPLTTNHQSACLFSQEHISASNTAISIAIWLNGGAFESVGNSIGYGIYNGPAGSTWVIQNHGLTSIPINKWTHIALVRNGTNFALFVNGIQVNSSTSATSCSLGTTQYMVARRWDVYGSYPYFNGYIDELRITKGVARYTTSFTPPREAMPNQ